VHFSTGCRPEAQSAFEKGVALLHSFQYEEARQTFAEVEKQDRKCAMAHWGKAMSLDHQLWDFPEAGKLEEGRKEVELANKLSPQSPREKGFVGAAAASFSSSTTHAMPSSLSATGRNPIPWCAPGLPGCPLNPQLP